ncbi:MAG: ABC transporter permease [Gemmatimonadota bacterium]|nr:ABC transporter permease [Gemmatimonadota bacterium]
MSSQRRVAQLSTPLFAVGGAIAVAATIITLAGLDAGAALRAAVDGAFGDSFAVLSATLKRMTPLLMLGIAVAVAFRAGVLNIGAEGQFLAGATAATAVALRLPGRFGPLVFLAALAAGAIAGAGWAAIAAWLRRRYLVTEVVSTLLLNFVALNLVGFLIRGPLQEPTGAYPQSSTIPDVGKLPLLFAEHRLHLGFLIALATALGTWWVLKFTAAGFRLRATGASPDAARSAGQIPVERVQAMALVASGAIAGLAGASELTGVTHALYEGISPGYGYTAIGVALLGGLHPGGIVIAAIFFGALGAGADAMQREAAVPAEFASVVAAIVILCVLAVPGLMARFTSGGRAGSAT